MPLSFLRLTPGLRLIAVWLALFGTAVLSGAATAATPTGPDPFSAVFSVGNDYVTAGEARLSLTRDDDGDGWVYRFTTRPKGLFKLTGKGRVEERVELTRTADGLWKPQSYRYRQDDERSRSVDAEFDWQAETLTYSARGTSETVPLPEHLLDRFSVTLDIWQSLRDGLDSTERQVFDAGRLKTMQIERVDEGPLDTAIGTLETVVVRTQTIGSSRHQLTWFAPELGYLPVKIEQYKRGDLVGRLTLESMQR